MPRKLLITNGDGAAGVLSEFASGEIIAWRDMLHEGPVPSRLGNKKLNVVRAEYLDSHGFAEKEEVLRSFSVRDEALSCLNTYDQVTLWFEHDLYDQLQLLQILDGFAASIRPPHLTLICIDRCAGVDPFYGLGQLSAAQMKSLWPRRRDVTLAQLQLARSAWRAFRSRDPRVLTRLAQQEYAALPFLSAALRRHLQQFPDERGLSRSEEIALQILSRGPATASEIFIGHNAREAAPFFGDWPFFDILKSLGSARAPLLEATRCLRKPLREYSLIDFGEVKLQITAAGHDVLAGRADHAKLNGLDVWRGGVHLVGENPRWRRIGNGLRLIGN